MSDKYLKNYLLFSFKKALDNYLIKMTPAETYLRSRGLNRR